MNLNIRKIFQWSREEEAVREKGYFIHNHFFPEAYDTILLFHLLGPVAVILILW